MISLPKCLAPLLSVTLIAGCGHSSGPTVRNYQTNHNRPRIAPDSLCYQGPDGNWICGGGGGSTGEPACTITTQTVATTPINRSRTTIGVGEEVTITSNGLGITVSSDNSSTLDTHTSPATLTAGAQAGSATVNVGARNNICSANSVQFTIIAPTTTYHNWDNNVAHDQGYADIGKWSGVFFAPDSVSFMNVWMQELSGSVSVNGTWYCDTTHNPTPPIKAATYVAGSGWQIGRDTASFGYCYDTQYSSGQYMNSTATVVIPTQYSLDDTSWTTVNTVTQYATDDTSGNMTISKDSMSGSTSVNSTNSGY